MYILLYFFFFFLMIRRPPRSTLSSSSAASDVYKRQLPFPTTFSLFIVFLSARFSSSAGLPQHLRVSEASLQKCWIVDVVKKRGGICVDLCGSMIVCTLRRTRYF
eukprot:TRINITY_DN18056_c0_g1_i3.p1 TRINITY_DN18056_c0_g1~~TRINITY_DN18056_c0_g1_i3.p1  ORF type:complete len:105 (-),score=24.71 TRINITY_DN18056_c0_g1_i3:184-498(-)